MSTTVARRPLLPLPTLPLPHRPSGSSRRSMRRFQHASRLVGMANNAISALNTLSSSDRRECVPLCYESVNPCVSSCPPFLDAPRSHSNAGLSSNCPTAAATSLGVPLNPYLPNSAGLSPRIAGADRNSAQHRLQRSVLNSVRQTLRCPSVRDDFYSPMLKPPPLQLPSSPQPGSK